MQNYKLMKKLSFTLAVFLIVTNLVAQIDFPNYEMDNSYFSDVKKFDSIGIVYFENIGETFWKAVPYSGWTTVTVGKVLKLNHEDENPYDNHPYSDLGVSSYLSHKGRSPNLFYRIENGKKYTGTFVDSIINKIGEKELSFRGVIIDGLLNGEGTFYFTSNDRIKNSGNFEKVTVGKVKSQGNFEKGKMIGHWKYFGFFGRSNWKRYDLLEERIYKKENTFPLEVMSYKFLISRSSEGKYSLYGNLVRKEKLLTDGSVENPDINNIFQITYYHPDYDTLTQNIVQAKGKIKITDEYTYKIDYWEFFHKNGVLYREGYISNNRESGIWKSYYENGQKQHIYDYIDVDPIKLESWDKKGILLIKNGIKIEK